eukprot:scaffold34071_cov48-Phaeocystis_antarctica.AAC.2
MPTVWWSQEDEGLAITVCINLAVSAGCLVPHATYLHPHHHNPRRLPRSHQPHFHPHRSRSCCSRVCPRSQPPVLTLHAALATRTSLLRAVRTRGTAPRTVRTRYGTSLGRAVRTAYRVVHPRRRPSTRHSPCPAAPPARCRGPKPTPRPKPKPKPSPSPSPSPSPNPNPDPNQVPWAPRTWLHMFCKGSMVKGAWLAAALAATDLKAALWTLKESPRRMGAGEWPLRRSVALDRMLPAQRRSSAALDHIRQGRPRRAADERRRWQPRPHDAVLTRYLVITPTAAASTARRCVDTLPSYHPDGGSLDRAILC